MSEKNSKVAICENCQGFVKACHVDYLKATKSEKSFTKLSNEGFIVKIETAEQTKAREWSDYEVCVLGKCVRKD